MPATKPVRPMPRPRIVTPAAGDDYNPLTQRQTTEGAQRAADQLRDRSGQVVSLAIGANVMNHNLGRKPSSVAITPTVADATWAWALTAADAGQATITCVGVAQPGAFVEFA